MAKPSRTFSADVGQKSTGAAGPDQIEYDLDNLFAMLDPLGTLRDGTTPGGIGEENFQDSSVTDAKIGNRTVDQTLVGGGNTGTLTQLLSWIVRELLSVKGTVNWDDAPATTIAALINHKHTGGVNAPQIGSDGIAAQAINVTHLDPALMTDVELNQHRLIATLDHPDGSVTELKLANGAVTTTKLGPVEAITLGGTFRHRYNSVDDTLDIEAAADGIPYVKSDSTFTGTYQDVEVI